MVCFTEWPPRGRHDLISYLNTDAERSSNFLKISPHESLMLPTWGSWERMDQLGRIGRPPCHLEGECPVGNLIGSHTLARLRLPIHVGHTSD